MLAAPPTPVHTPGKLPPATFCASQNPPDTPPQTPLQPKHFKKVADVVPLYNCDETGDDHSDNRLRFSELTQLSVELAAIFRPLCLDYINVPTYHTTDTPLARQMLRRDVKSYQGRITSNTTKVERNTILRALTLFSLCSYHATQYLEHNADDRVKWLNLLNTSGIWLKPFWEKDIAKRMVGLMEQDFSNISITCDPEVVYSMVHNSYFLMLFARYEYSELSDELRLLEAKPYSWHDLSFLRKRYFQIDMPKGVDLEVAL